MDKEIPKTLNPNLMVTSALPWVHEMKDFMKIFSQGYPQVLGARIRLFWRDYSPFFCAPVQKMACNRERKQKGGRPEDPPP